MAPLVMMNTARACPSTGVAAAPGRAPRAQTARRTAGVVGGSTIARMTRSGEGSHATGHAVKDRRTSSRRRSVAVRAAGHVRSGAPSPAAYPAQPADVVPDAFRYAPRRGSKVGTAGAGATGAIIGATGATKDAKDDGKDAAANNNNKVGAKKLRVAYQGMAGAYSEAAALTAYPTCEPCPQAQFENAFEATEQWTVDRAVLPFENSLGGSIHRNYDLILNHRLHIVGEVYFKVSHCLLALPGQKKEDIQRAMSHPQALSQCDGYLSNLGVIKEAVDDTAGAAAYIAENNLMGAAAVASRRAADLYGMEVLDEDIQDDQSNVTRFLALAREPLSPREGVAYKTSIACSMKEDSGALFKALACFALRDINLTKVESRPMRWNPVTQQATGPMQFSYLFYIDFEASMADPNAQNALRQLQETATFLRVLGSYPADETKL